MTQKTLRKAVEIIKSLIDDEKCRYDHHGNCQTHRLENPCEVAEARKFLLELEQ
jgi:hypothetical protein